MGSAELLAAYEKWAKDVGEPVVQNQRELNSRLEAKGFKRARVGHAGARGWGGLALRPNFSSSNINLESAPANVPELPLQMDAQDAPLCGAEGDADIR